MGELTQLETYPFWGGGWRSQFVRSISNKICLRLQTFSLGLVLASNIFTQICVNNHFVAAFLVQTTVFASIYCICVLKRLKPESRLAQSLNWCQTADRVLHWTPDHGCLDADLFNTDGCSDDGCRNLIQDRWKYMDHIEDNTFNTDRKNICPLEIHVFWNAGRRALALNDSKTDDAQNPPCESQHPILALAPPDSPAPAWLKNVFKKLVHIHFRESQMRKSSTAETGLDLASLCFPILTLFANDWFQFAKKLRAAASSRPNEFGLFLSECSSLLRMYFSKPNLLSLSIIKMCSKKITSK